jgi:hypothetical protein
MNDAERLHARFLSIYVPQSKENLLEMQPKSLSGLTQVTFSDCLGNRANHRHGTSLWISGLEARFVPLGWTHQGAENDQGGNDAMCRTGPATFGASPRQGVRVPLRMLV